MPMTSVSGSSRLRRCISVSADSLSSWLVASSRNRICGLCSNAQARLSGCCLRAIPIRGAGFEGNTGEQFAAALGVDGQVLQDEDAACFVAGR